MGRRKSKAPNPGGGREEEAREQAEEEGREDGWNPGTEAVSRATETPPVGLRTSQNKPQEIWGPLHTPLSLSVKRTVHRS